MATLTITIPDKIKLNKKDTLRFLAAKMYESGRLSLGQASEMVNMSKNSFAGVLNEYGVAYINYSAQDVLDDVKRLQARYS